jgi:hypothetical protein
MTSYAALNQPKHVVMLKVRVPVDKAGSKDRARYLVQDYLVVRSQITFVTLDNRYENSKAYVVTVLLQGWGTNVDAFVKKDVYPQIDRLESTGLMRVTKSTLFAPQEELV